MDIPRMKSLANDDIIKLAVDAIKKDCGTFDINRFDQIRVEKSDEEIYVSFEMSVKFFPFSRKRKKFSYLANVLFTENKVSPHCPENIFTPDNEVKELISVIRNKLMKKDDSAEIYEYNDAYEISINHPATESATGGAEGYRMDKKTGDIKMIWHEHPEPLSDPQ